MQSSTTPVTNKRIEIADVLRGFAVLGITLVHFIERFSINSHPEQTNTFLKFTDTILWDSTFFAFSGKAYAIFALLFGFSFFIQENSQREKGNDFRGRFAWRLLILFFIACVNSTLFPGEILVLYAFLGYILIAVCRFSTRMVLLIAVILLLQPIEWGQLIYTLANPDHMADYQFDAPYWELVNTVQKEGSFLEMCKTTIWTGNIANMGWMLLHGRVTQTAGLFMIGMVIGRRSLFPYSEKNMRFWISALILSITAFFPMYGLLAVMPDFISSEALLVPSLLIIKSLSNVAFTGILFAGIILAYYQTKFGRVLHLLAPYGRASLTNYLSQSLIGGFLFCNWGLGLYRHTGITTCFFMGIGVFLLQYIFCCWWLRSHRQGPLEFLWKKATWIKINHRF